MGTELRHMQALHLTDKANFKKAYNALALTKHPDKGGDPEEFKIIQQAKDFFEAQAQQEKELMAERERELEEQQRSEEEDARWEVEFQKFKKKREDDAAQNEWLDKNKDGESDSDVEVLTRAPTKDTTQENEEETSTKKSILKRRRERKARKKNLPKKKKKKKNKKKKKEEEEDDGVSGEDYTSLYFPGFSDRIGKQGRIRTGARRMCCPYPNEHQTTDGGAAPQADETRSD